MGTFSSWPLRKAALFGALACLSVALSAAVAPAARSERSGPPAQTPLPDGPGKELVLKLCSSCHSAQKVVGLGRTREEWEASVADMVVSRGAQGSEEEFYEIVEYLAKNFPKSAAGEKINVNKAMARELGTALELSTKEAEAIVRFREKKGNFKSVEELKKVPGLDAKKIDAKKSRLAFE